MGLGPAVSDDKAIFTVAAMVGAMVLSPAVDDTTLADRLIEVARRRLDPDLAAAGKADDARSPPADCLEGGEKPVSGP